MKKVFGCVIFLIAYILMAFSNIYCIEDQEIINMLSIEDMPVSLKINGDYILTNNEIIRLDDYYYIKLRDIMNVYGVNQINYDEKTKAIAMTDGVHMYQLAINQPYMMMDGMIYPIDSIPLLIEGSTYISFDLISIIFDSPCEYDEEMATIILENEDYIISDQYKADYDLTDLLWLSRIVNVEASNLPPEGNIAIANVVLNRRKSDLFPNTVHDIIFEIDYHVQFPPAHRSGFKTSLPSNKAIKASIIALNGYNNIDDCLYFNNSPFRSKANDLYKIIEGEYFYH